MSISIDRVHQTETENVITSIVELLEVYVDQKYGKYFWDRMFDIDEFSELILKHYPKYGDAVFQDLVHIIVSYLSIRTKEFLEDFSIFITTYY